jgi:hypothetical protein
MANAQPASYGRVVSIVARIGVGKEAESMIARAEAACERYLQAASEPGLGTLALRKRRDNWRAMERVLARLRDQSKN